MKTKVVAIAALWLIFGTFSANAASTRRPVATNFIVAGGGTPVSNGFFFPGTAFCDGSGCTGVPLPVPEGEDITFVNLDASAVTNAHQILSEKYRRGTPIFSSEVVDGPGVGTVQTSHLKPGIYRYFCNFHFPMYGQIEILE